MLKHQAVTVFSPHGLDWIAINSAIEGKHGVTMQAWQKYNSPALDFDLCFQTDNLQKLQHLLSDDERQLFRLSWKCKDWQRYMTTYMAGIRHRVLKQPTVADAARHDFVPWPVRLPAEGIASKPLGIKPTHA